VQHSGGDQLLDCAARLERGVQLDDRLRPEQALLELVIDVAGDSRVADVDEAPREVRVVVDETLAQIENVYGPDSLTTSLLSTPRSAISPLAPTDKSDLTKSAAGVNVYRSTMGKTSVG
jgi:hypothetical protein